MGVTGSNLANPTATGQAATAASKAAANRDNALSPQQLADLDRKRRELEGGGGGGGGIRKEQGHKVDFGILAMSYKSAQTLQENIAANRAFVPPQFVADITSALQNFAKPIIAVLQTLQNNLNNTLAFIAQAPMNLLKLAQTLASSLTNLATVAASALANKLFKNIFGKDEDEDTKIKPDGEEENFSGRLKKIFAFIESKDNGNEKSVISHIKNIADQITSFFKF